MYICQDCGDELDEDDVYGAQLEMCLCFSCWDFIMDFYGDSRDDE